MFPWFLKYQDRRRTLSPFERLGWGLCLLLLAACGSTDGASDDTTEESETYVPGGGGSTVPGPFNKECLNLANNCDKALQMGGVNNLSNLGGRPQVLTPTQERKVPTSYLDPGPYSPTDPGKPAPAKTGASFRSGQYVQPNIAQKASY